MEARRCPGPMRRREFLQAGVLAIGGLSLPEVLAARASAGTSNSETAVILLYLHGGPSQLETYDLKPQAPSEYRSVFNPISTSIPGMEICELFPLQSKIADKFSLVRSLQHTVGIHSDGGIVVLTGKTPSRLDPSSQSVSEHPDFGSIADRMLGLHPDAIPRYVAVPQRPYMTRPAYLGVHHGSFVPGNPADADYAPPRLQLAAGLEGAGLDQRRTLLAQLDKFRSDLDQRSSLDGTDKFRELAFQMLTSPRTADAFDISREDAELRDRYGRNTWGQSCLLARRLAEAGTSVVSVWINTPRSGEEFTNWDDHGANAGRPGHFAKYMRVRLPYLDQALSALIEDIFARGLDRKIMVVAMGEFGRTPRISYYPPKDAHGRDHWPNAYTALVSGGGLKMGQVVGATNSKSEYPTERPHSPNDLLATIYRHLGIDYRHSFADYSGRPIPILNDGDPIAELL